MFENRPIFGFNDHNSGILGMVYMEHLLQEFILTYGNWLSDVLFYNAVGLTILLLIITILSIISRR